MQLTLGTEQPLHEDFNLRDVSFETEFALIKRKDDGLALSLQGGYQKSVIGLADVLGFGPIVELACQTMLITLNPLFTFRSAPTGILKGLDSNMVGVPSMISPSTGGSAWRCSGEIEDLTNAGAFNQPTTVSDLPYFGARPRMLETLATEMRPKKKAQEQRHSNCR